MALECLLLTRSSRLMELADANLIQRDGSKVLISVEKWSGHQAHRNFNNNCHLWKYCSTNYQYSAIRSFIIVSIHPKQKKIQETVELYTFESKHFLKLQC